MRVERGLLVCEYNHCEVLVCEYNHCEVLVREYNHCEVLVCEYNHCVGAAWWLSGLFFACWLLVWLGLHWMMLRRMHFDHSRENVL